MKETTRSTAETLSTGRNHSFVSFLSTLSSKGSTFVRELKEKKALQKLAKTLPKSSSTPTHQTEYPGLTRRFSCKTDFYTISPVTSPKSDASASIDFLWKGEKLGLVLRRRKRGKLQAKEIIWRKEEDSLGLTFTVDRAANVVTVSRRERLADTITLGDILYSVDNRIITGDEFEKIMTSMKVKHEDGYDQRLIFHAAPYPACIKEAGDVLQNIGITQEYVLDSINDLNIQYLSLSDISDVLKTSQRPTLLRFQRSSQAKQLMALDQIIKPDKCTDMPLEALAIGAISAIIII